MLQNSWSKASSLTIDRPTCWNAVSLTKRVDRCGHDPNGDRPDALGERILCFSRRDGDYGNKGSVWCSFLFRMVLGLSLYVSAIMHWEAQSVLLSQTMGDNDRCWNTGSRSKARGNNSLVLTGSRTYKKWDLFTATPSITIPYLDSFFVPLLLYRHPISLASVSLSETTDLQSLFQSATNIYS